MAINLSRILKHLERTAGVVQTVREYEDHFEEGRRGGLESRRRTYERFTILYFDLVTDFYEFGWGRSFHFAPRVPGESFKASLTRHEHFLAPALELGPGMVAADLGCGIGGPLLEIARHTGAKIVGVNSNGYQLERARMLTEEAGLTHLAEFMHCDFLNVDAPDSSFDAVYAIEATCCAPDKPSIYGEILRLLKPGGLFGAYEYCLTDRFDASNPHHLKIKADMELGGGLLEIEHMQTVDDALRVSGVRGVGNARPHITDRSVNPVVSAAGRVGSVPGRFSRFKGRALGYPQHAAGAGDAAHCAAGNGPSIEDTEPLRGWDD